MSGNEEEGESLDLLVDPEEMEDIINDCYEEQTSPCPDNGHNKLVILYSHFLLAIQSVAKLSNATLSIFLLFIVKFFEAMLKRFPNGPMSEFVGKLPRTVYQVKKATNIKDTFQKYIYCQKCNSIYKSEDLLGERLNSSKRQAYCSYAKFPHHPHPSKRRPCNQPLFKSYRTSAGKTLYFPKMIYCYKSIKTGLEAILMRKGMLEKCQHWRNVGPTPDLTDVYHGSIWKEFQEYKSLPLLSSVHTFAFMLNLDFFQPFDHTPYSLGAIYLAIQNLPRVERFKPENILLLGLIPGPKEPANLNFILEPLVAELKAFWNNGVEISTDCGKILARAVLLCVACDTPAARKVSGFVNFNAHRGCLKCLKAFTYAADINKPNYGGFDTENWPKRELSLVHSFADKWHLATSQQAQRKIQQEYGIKYSVLLELPYFDPTRMVIIDPMHNLLLGTAKHMMTIWKETGKLKPNDFQSIQEKVDNFIGPSDVGRIPFKLSSGFSSFSADQWKNWVLLFSLPCLRPILPINDYKCWQTFVKACSILCSRIIKPHEIAEAHKLLTDFCIQTEALYSPKYLTPNMHLHLHLQECIRDFGPVYSFWLFAFERMNGLLGGYPTNNRSVEIQLMRKFCMLDFTVTSSLPQEYQDDFGPLLGYTNLKGSLSVCFKPISSDKIGSRSVIPLPPIFESSLDRVTKEALIVISCGLFEGQIDIGILCSKCNCVRINGSTIGSFEGRFHACSRVLAHKDTATQATSLCRINYFIKVSTQVTVASGLTNVHSVWFANVNFFIPDEFRYWLGTPCEIWTTSLEIHSVFIPIQNICSRVIWLEADVHFGTRRGSDRVLIVSQIPL